MNTLTTKDNPDRPSQEENYFTNSDRRLSYKIYPRSDFDDLDDEDPMPLPNEIPDFLNKKFKDQEAEDNYIHKISKKYRANPYNQTEKRLDKVHKLEFEDRQPRTYQTKGNQIERSKNKSPAYQHLPSDFAYLIKQEENFHDPQLSSAPYHK